MLRVTPVVLLALATQGLSQSPCTLKTIAGPSTFYTGDGGPAVNARFYNVEGFRFDSSGNLFIADSGNQRIREVTPDGLVRTIAGTGVAGFTGDGGPATSAELNTPIAVTPDDEGNIFIVDQGNNRIRKIDASGTISTVAGNGTANYGGDGGPAVSAELQHPQDLVVDVNGNLYVSDSWNYRVRKITAQGIISTVAGNGQHPYPAQDNERAAGTDQPLNLPAGLAVDAKGNLYISDSGADRVFVVDPDGTISTYAGTGTIGVIQDGSPATATPIQFPTGLALDGLGNLIIASESGTLEVEPSGTLSVISSGENYYYGAVGFNQNSLYVAYRNSIYAVANASAPPIAGALETGNSGDGGPATQALLFYPDAIAVDKNSNVYIADQYASEIRKVGPDGTISHVAGTGQMGDSGDGGPAASAAIGLITALAVDPMGNLYLSDFGSNVRKIDTSGIISTVTPVPTGNSAYALKVDSQGNLYIRSQSALNVYKPSFSTFRPFSTYQDVAAFALDSADALYILSTYGPTSIIQSTPAGQKTIMALPQLPQFQSGGMEIDAAGNFLIAWNGVVQQVTPDGRVASIARQSGTLPYMDGAVLQVDLGYPTYTSIDPAGNLYLAEPYTSTVRELTAGCAVPVQPLISNGGVVNAGSYQGEFIAPGEIIAIFGQNLGPAQGVGVPVSDGAFPFTYQGVQVTINGYPAPLLYVSANQVNAIAPFELSGQYLATLQLTLNGVASDPYPSDPAATDSGIFAIANSDGAANSAAQPAKAGDYITIYGTGQGIGAIPEVDGQILGSTLVLPVQPVAVTIDLSMPATVLYAGSAPSLVAGVLQVNVALPSDLSSGAHTIVLGLPYDQSVPATKFYVQ